MKRGYFYQAAMYYLSDMEQPLRFIEPNENGTFSIVRRIENFQPREIGGRKRAVEQNVVVTVKPRQVIVLSQNRHFEYVQMYKQFLFQVYTITSFFNPGIKN